MANLTEILQHCRLCLVKNNVNVPIFENHNENGEIFLKISSCLPVTVSRDDELPKNICDDCSNKLDLAYEFRNSSVVAEKQLQQWLQDVNVKNDPKKTNQHEIKEEPDDTFVSVPESLGFEPEKVSTSKTRKQNRSEPPPKRARRAAAMKRPVNIPSESDEDADDVEPLFTKEEDESGSELDTESHDPTFEDIPTSSADQPGPSGVGKDRVESHKGKGKKKQNKSPPQPVVVGPLTECTVKLTKLNIEQLKLKLPVNPFKEMTDTFKCLACQKLLNDHFSGGEYKCCKCDREKMFSRFKLARHCYHYHYLNRTEPLDMIECKECPEKFDRLIDQRRHMLDTHKKTSNTSETNNDRDEDCDSLSSADDDNEESSVENLACTVCFDEFETKEEFKEHKELHAQYKAPVAIDADEEINEEDESGPSSIKYNPFSENNVHEEETDVNEEGNCSHEEDDEEKKEELDNSITIENGDLSTGMQLPLITDVQTVDESIHVEEKDNCSNCLYCNKMFEKELAFLKHKKRYLNCMKCDSFVTCNARKMRVHYSIDHSSEYCTLCSFLPNDKEDWSKHLDEYHKCKKCSTVRMKGKCVCAAKISSNIEH